MAAPATPTFRQLLGHEVRWGLLSELARSDRTVRELCGALAQPQSLVSYHLAKLRRVEVVRARRSSADGRDTYYSLDLARVGDLLAATGAELHPGLRLERRRPERPPAPRAAPTPTTTPEPAPGSGNGRETRARVLFLCTGNSARSQIAEALMATWSGGAVEAHSAGSRPKPLHPNAARVLREEHGVDLGDRRPKHLEVYAGQRFDHVVSLCDRVREVCPPFPDHPAFVHWSVPDPSAGEPDPEAAYPAFVDVAADIASRVEFLLAAIAPLPPAAAMPPAPSAATSKEQP